MRTPDWPKKLAEALDSAKKTGFIWGENDCCLFSCNVVLAMTGEDPAAFFRGKYKTKTGAARALKEFGAGGIRETATKLLGPEVPLRNAGRGDLVLANLGQGDSLGVCVGESAAFLVEHRFVFVRLGQCKTAWRIH